MQDAYKHSDPSQRARAAEFTKDPWLFLDQARQEHGDVFWLPDRQLCLGEPAGARAVLANVAGLYEPHSDFFHTPRGVLGPRAVQVRLRRATRKLLRAHIGARASALPTEVARVLAGTSEWPDAGNWLVYRHLAGVLLAPGTAPRLERTIDEVVERAVLVGARERRSQVSRLLFRWRVKRALREAITQRRARRAPTPRDLLDVVAGTAAPAADLAEVFLSFVFAIAGSMGFLCAWSIYLMGTHPVAPREPAWIVREALRLWPVAWLMARRPAQPHDVGGTAVTARDEVLVCPYLVQRHPRHWEAPNSFRPERWAGLRSPDAFIPFGWGAHRCVAESLSLQVVEDLIRIVVDGYEVTVSPRAARPLPGAALAPPRFSLQLVPVAVRSPREKGGE